MSTNISEIDIFNELVEPTNPTLSPLVAKAFLDLQFSPVAIERFNDLAEKNRQDTLTETERATFEKYLRVGSFVNLLKAKARVSLGQSLVE